MMMPQNASIEVVIEPLVCVTCGCTFGMQREAIQNFRRNLTPFSCPAGHWQTFKDNEAEKLKVLNEALQKEKCEHIKVIHEYDEVSLKNEQLRSQIKGLRTRIKKLTA